MFRLLTDFNEIQDGHAGGIVEDLTGGEIQVGDWVLLHDLDSEVWGTVTEIANGAVTARLHWDTWGRAGRYQEAGSGRDGWWLYLDVQPEIAEEQPVVSGTNEAGERVDVALVRV